MEQAGRAVFELAMLGNRVAGVSIRALSSIIVEVHIQLVYVSTSASWLEKEHGGCFLPLILTWKNFHILTW